MTKYHVTVRYRTNSGCNAKDYEIEAADMETAIDIATEKQRKRRGVIKIDSGDCVPAEILTRALGANCEE